MSGKRILLFCVIAILLVLLATPFIMGMRFKQVYYNQIKLIQDQVLGKSATISVISYHQGWFSSSAVAMISYADANNPSYQSYSIPLYFHSTIKHGPMVRNANDTAYKFAYANVTTRYSMLAEGISAPYNLKMTSVVSFSGQEWDTHYVMVMTSSFPLIWEGIIGDNFLNITNQRLTLAGKMRSERFEMKNPTPFTPSIKISPVNSTYHLEKDFNALLWNIKNSIAFESLEVDAYKLNNAVITGNYGPEGSYFNYAHNVSINSLQIPASFPVTSISNFKHRVEIKNLSANGIYNYSTKGYSVRDPASILYASNLLSILTASSNVTITLSAMTDLGGVDASIVSSLKSMPATLDDLDKVTLIVIHIRASKNLVDKSLSPMQTQARYFNDLVQQGLVVIDNQDYVFDMKVDGNQKIINGKDVTNQLPQMLEHARIASIPPEVAVAEVMQYLQFIVQSSDMLASSTGSYLSSHISDTTISTAAGEGILNTSWGSKMTIGNVTKTTYTLTLPNVPADICPLLKTQISSGKLYTLDNTVCDPSAPTHIVLTHTLPPAALGGTINVVSATYGANCGVAAGNVTNALSQACNFKTSCPYQINPQLIGDPAYGCAKIYEAQWRCGTEEKINSLTVPAEADMKFITLSCPAVIPQPPMPQTGAITVLRATYGGNCRVTQGNDTATLGQACNFKTVCHYQVSTERLGDPAYGCAKIYQAQWRCGDSEETNWATLPAEADGKVLTLSCPP